MAIIQCPECGNKVSSFSEVCPFCSHPINKNKIVEQLNIKEQIVVSKPNFTFKPKNNFWIYEWKAKVRKTKIRSAIPFILNIIGLIISACLLSFDIDLSYGGPKIIHLIFTLIFSCFIIFSFSCLVATLICCKVEAVQLDGYVVLGYVGFFKNILVIEGVIQDSEYFKRHLYGSLPNKKQVLMKVLTFSYDIKFEITDSKKIFF